MIRQFCLTAILFSLATTSGLPCVRAGEPIPKPSGWSFRLGAGAGYMSSTDQLRPSDGNKRVKNLDDNANRYDRVMPLVNYAHPLGQGWEVVPEAGFTIGAIDGDANRYLGYRFKLGLRRFHAGHLLNLSLGAGYRDYDAEHPIFDKDRNDTLFNVFGMYTRSNLFGYSPLFCHLIAGFSHRSSNIDFLGADTFMSGLMLG